MPNENDTEATREDALNAYESLFGDSEPSAGDAVAEEQEAKTETGEEQQLGSEVAEEQAGAGHGGADESDQDPRESDIPEKQGDEDQAGEKEADSSEDLKVVLSIKDGRATIGCNSHRRTRTSSPSTTRTCPGWPGGFRKCSKGRAPNGRTNPSIRPTSDPPPRPGVGPAANRARRRLQQPREGKQTNSSQRR